MKTLVPLALLFPALLLASCSGPSTPPITQETPSKQETSIQKDVQKEVQQGEVSGDTEEKLNATMIEIFKRGKPATCTFKMTSEGTTFDAVMYVDGRKLRYNMIGSVEGHSMENNTIQRDGYSYSWTSTSKTGWKMKDEPEDESGEDEGGSEMEAQEMNERVEFTCKKGVDSAVFDIPTDISFQEI